MRSSLIEAVISIMKALGFTGPGWEWRYIDWRKGAEGRTASGRENLPVLCPACGSLIGSAETRCGFCGASRSGRDLKGIRASAARLTALPDFTVRLLITAYITVFVAAMLAGPHMGISPAEVLFGRLPPDFLVAIGGLQGLLVLGGQYYRLITATFVHIGILHLLFNAMALKVVGPETERVYGRSRFLILYILSGLIGNIVSVLFHGISLYQAGASGALCGLIGMLYAHVRGMAGFHAARIRSILLRWMAFIILFGFFIGADNAAHLGGFAGGFILAAIIRPGRETIGWEAAELVVYTLVAISWAFVLLS